MLSSGSILEIIFDLFSFNEVDIFLGKKEEISPIHAALITRHSVPCDYTSCT